MNIKKGDTKLLLTSWPNGKLKIVRIMCKNTEFTNGWNIEHEDGSVTVASQEFLFDSPYDTLNAHIYEIPGFTKIDLKNEDTWPSKGIQIKFSSDARMNAIEQVFTVKKTELVYPSEKHEHLRLYYDDVNWFATSPRKDVYWTRIPQFQIK